jgi:hypothetical protein
MFESLFTPHDSVSARSPSRAYCRACQSTFERPLPSPYGGICPDCLGRGNIVTLTDMPRHARGERHREHTTAPEGPRGRVPARL